MACETSLTHNSRETINSIFCCGGIEDDFHLTHLNVLPKLLICSFFLEYRILKYDNNTPLNINNIGIYR